MIGVFDRLGYLRHRRRFDAADLDVDLGGRTCVVTGGNAGLGLATARALAVRGATVHLLCRDPDRGEAARDDLRRETGSDRIHLGVVDLSSLASVERYVRTAAPDRVDVLVHNAGVLPASRVLTPGGHELTFATHVAGPHLLTRRLAPHLQAGPDGRVIFVSSGGMYTQRLDLGDLRWERRPYDGVIAYAQTKRMQVILAELWARELGGSGVGVHAMHPGWADTGGVRSSLPRFHALTRLVLRTPEEGADTIVWLAVRRPPPPTGRFWFDRAAVRTHYLPWTREAPEDRDRLWALAERAGQG